jgi:hypothetical protein
MRSGGLLYETTQRDIAEQTEVVVNLMFIAPIHHLGPAVMTVAANGDLRVGPVLADAARAGRPARQATTARSAKRTSGGIIPG